MSAAKFTPGPWTVDTEGRAPWVWIGDFAVHVPSFEDARLIAAAPELFDELQKAHRLVALMLTFIPTSRLREFTSASEKAGIGDEGATRRYEREAIIAKALGSAS